MVDCEREKFMEMFVRYMSRKVNDEKNLLEFELDLKKFMAFAVLERAEAERQVLLNINKIELMQFLGLKDKKGRIIYFGDILIDEFDNLLTPVCEISNSEHILFFKPIQYLNKDINIGCKSTYSNTLEVVGNIYKNSELFTGFKDTNNLINWIMSAKRSDFTKTIIRVELNRGI